MNHRRRYSQALCAAVAAVSSAVMLGPAGAVGASVRATGPSFDTWEMFGHDAMHSGVAPDTTIGASSAPSLAQRWSQPLSSTLDKASPAVAYNTVLKKTLVFDVTHSGVVSAFNASTGALVWRRTMAPNVFSSPAIYSNTVYFGDNEGKLEALNAATGAVECTFTLPVSPPATKPGRIFSSPVVGAVDGTGPTVFFGDAGVVSGSSEPLNGGQTWAVTGVGNTAGSCKLRWSYNQWLKKGSNGTMTGVWIEPALAKQSNGTWAVVFGTSNPDCAIYALNAANGSLLWRFQTAQPSTDQDEDVGTGPTISAPGVNGFADGVVYNDGKDGIEYALDLLTGKQIWSFTLGPGTFQAFAVSEAALTGNTLVTVYASHVFALNATTGAMIWEVTPGGNIQASSAVSGGPGDQVVFLGDLADHEFGLSLASGATLFEFTTTGKVVASSAVAKGVLYFASGGSLYAFTPGTAVRA
jgi:outer membrane protein assembly factor BamB